LTCRTSPTPRLDGRRSSSPVSANCRMNSRATCRVEVPMIKTMFCDSFRDPRRRAMRLRWHRFVFSRLQLLTPPNAPRRSGAVRHASRARDGPPGSVPPHRGGYSSLPRGLLALPANLTRRHGRQLRRVQARRAFPLTGRPRVHRSAGPSHVARIHGLHCAANPFKKNASTETACRVLHRSLEERRSFVAIRCVYATCELEDKAWSRV